MPRTPAPERTTTSIHLRVGALDMLLVAAGISGWSVLGTVDPRVLSAVLLLRVCLTQSHLWLVLGPVRRWRALGPNTPDGDLLAADEAMQARLMGFISVYGLSWIAAPVLAFVITVALPALGYVPAHAEYMTLVMGSLACITLSYAFMLARGVSVAHDLVHELARQLRTRGLRPSRRPRTFATILRNFSIAFTIGMLSAAFVLGGKARIDGQREHALANQSVRLALAAQDLARTGELGADPDGGVPIERVTTEQLPALLSPAPGETRLEAFDPTRERVLAAISIGDDKWLLAEGDPDEQLALFAALMAALTLSLGVAAGLGAIGISRLVTEPLGHVRALARRMVEVGDLRALERPVADHNDEVGSLIDDLNLMLDSLEQLARAAETVATGALDVELDQPGDLHEAFRVMLEQLARIVARLRETALEVSSASTELHASMQAQERGATQMAVDVERSAAKVSSLASSAQRISDAADEVLTFAEQSLVNVDLLADKSAALNAEAAGISELLELVRGIADRSDLLALNGSLEATRAGEGGRGFGLVAAEMRRLAERVTLTIADVRVRVADIEAAGVATTQATQQSRALAKATANAAREIATLTRTQTADTREVSTTTSDMARYVRESSAGISQISATAKGLRDHVGELEQLTASFNLGVAVRPLAREARDDASG